MNKTKQIILSVYGHYKQAKVPDHWSGLRFHSWACVHKVCIDVICSRYSSLQVLLLQAVLASCLDHLKMHWAHQGVAHFEEVLVAEQGPSVSEVTKGLFWSTIYNHCHCHCRVGSPEGVASHVEFVFPVFPPEWHRYVLAFVQGCPRWEFRWIT